MEGGVPRSQNHVELIWKILLGSIGKDVENRIKNIVPSQSYDFFEKRDSSVITVHAKT